MVYQFDILNMCTNKFKCLILIRLTHIKLGSHTYLFKSVEFLLKEFDRVFTPRRQETLPFKGSGSQTISHFHSTVFSCANIIAQGFSNHQLAFKHDKRNNVPL